MYPKLANWSTGIVAAIVRRMTKLTVRQRKEMADGIQRSILIGFLGEPVVLQPEIGPNIGITYSI